MKSLLERCQEFKQIKYTRVTRNGLSYSQTEQFTRRVLKICVWTYQRLPEANQTARLIRDLIDFTLRRFQGYCIKEKFGAHYREVGLQLTDRVDFEHVIPAAIARDMLLHNLMTVDEAMNIPTCMVSRRNHKRLNKKNASTTPDIFNFWQRYKILNIMVETHNGTPVNMNTWNLATHYQYFNI